MSQSSFAVGYKEGRNFDARLSMVCGYLGLAYMMDYIRQYLASLAEW